MNLSSETLNILKSFSTINSSIAFNIGSKIRTTSVSKNILAEVVVDEVFDRKFGVYDLNQFLTVLSMYKDGFDIEFGPVNAVITGMSGRSVTNYRLCDPEMVIKPDENNDIEMPDTEIQFELTGDDLAWIIRTASILGSPKIAVESKGDKISLLLFDPKNDAASVNTLDVGVGNGDEYQIVFGIEMFRLISGSYDVKISSQGIAHFKHKTVNLQYWMSTDKGSFYRKG